MMPGMDGPQICREVRRRNDRAYVYLLLLTSRDQKQDIIAGLEAGADDYLVKPFDTFEMQARLNVGRRILGLQSQLLEACEELHRRATLDLIIMPRCGAGHITSLAERLRASVAAGPVCFESKLIPVTVSLGVSVSEDPATGGPQHLLQSADTALYRAKHGGRNRVELAVATETLFAPTSA
jgi:PleD family two-component response regulator